MNTLYDVFHYRNTKRNGIFGLNREVIDYYDLTMVVKGELSYTVNNEHILLQSADVMLLPPGTVRSRFERDNTVTYISFNFRSNEKIDLPFLMKGALTKEILSLFNAFTPQYLSSQTRGKEKAANIVGYILEVLTEFNINISQNHHIKKAIEYIDEHISDPITLSDLASILHLSREYTANIFKKETGMTVSTFINNRKLALACDMLRSGDTSLTEISKSLGYENYGYFSRIFKKKFGISPMRYIQHI